MQGERALNNAANVLPHFGEQPRSASDFKCVVAASLFKIDLHAERRRSHLFRAQGVDSRRQVDVGSKCALHDSVRKRAVVSVEIDSLPEDLI